MATIHSNAEARSTSFYYITVLCSQPSTVTLHRRKRCKSCMRCRTWVETHTHTYIYICIYICIYIYMYICIYIYSCVRKLGNYTSKKIIFYKAHYTNYKTRWVSGPVFSGLDLSWQCRHGQLRQLRATMLGLLNGYNG